MIVYILLLVWNSGNGATSEQVIYSTRAACLQAQAVIMKEWNDGSSANGHRGYLSSSCLEDER